MKRHLSKTASSAGSTLLIALMFVFVGTIALTCWGYMTAARLRQSEALNNAFQRHIIWGNSEAINQQYAYTDAFQSNLSQSAYTTTVSSGWGGVAENSYANLNVFSTLQEATGGNYSFAFNNIRVPPSSNGSLYFAQTSGGADPSQSEHFYLYNYLKAFPRPLMGDLFILHLRPVAATSGAVICPNIQVYGRAVIMDSTASTGSLVANECFNNVITGTNTTLNSAGGAQLPDNYPHVPCCTAGYGGVSMPTADTTGDLNMIDNPTFPAGSIKAAIVASGTYTVYSSTSPSGTGSSPVQITNQVVPTYPAPLPIVNPYGYVASIPMKVIQVNLLNSALTHTCITGTFDQVVLQGETNQTDYNTASTLAPVVVMLENSTTRDIRLVGENSRPLILTTGQGAGETIYMGFSGTSAVVGGPLRWRIHLVNQYCSLWLGPPSGLNVAWTGSIRTDWSVYCTDSTSTLRVQLSADTNPGGLQLLLPRDAWNEVYLYNK